MSILFYTLKKEVAVVRADEAPPDWLRFAVIPIFVATPSVNRWVSATVTRLK
jgi:hypothetical protein